MNVTLSTSRSSSLALTDLDVQMIGQAAQIAHQVQTLYEKTGMPNYRAVWPSSYILMKRQFENLRQCVDRDRQGETLNAAKTLSICALFLLNSMKYESPLMRDNMNDFMQETRRLKDAYHLAVPGLEQSDLILVSEAQRKLVPNGATREEAASWRRFLDQVANGETQIQITDSENGFKRELLNCFEILMGRECGRTLLWYIAASPFPVRFVEGDCCLTHFLKEGEERAGYLIEMSFSLLPLIVRWEAKNYNQYSFPFVHAYHEMVHWYHDIQKLYGFNPPSDPNLTDAREELTITGNYGSLSSPLSENGCREAFGLSERVSHLYPGDPSSPQQILLGAIILNQTGDIRRILSDYPPTQEEWDSLIRLSSQNQKKEMTEILTEYGKKRRFSPQSIPSRKRKVLSQPDPT